MHVIPDHTWRSPLGRTREPHANGGGGMPTGLLGEEIDKVYGSFDSFKDAFAKVGFRL